MKAHICTAMANCDCYAHNPNGTMNGVKSRRFDGASLAAIEDTLQSFDGELNRRNGNHSVQVLNEYHSRHLPRHRDQKDVLPQHMERLVAIFTVAEPLLYH